MYLIMLLIFSLQYKGSSRFSSPARRLRLAHSSSREVENHVERAIRIENHIDNKVKSFGIEGRKRCPTCWLYKSVCLCGKMAELREQVHSDLSSEVVVFMHHREYGKASNTGKLASLVAPSKCRTEIYGTRSGNAAIEELCDAKDKQLIVLFPSADSYQLSEFSSNGISHGNDKFCNSNNGNLNMTESHSVCNMRDNEKTLVLAVLDSTWSQARSMNRLFPRHIPRVHIDDEVTAESLYLCRTQSAKVIKNVGRQQQSNKVSTIEAIEKALHVLSEPPDVLKAFTSSLKLTVDSVYVQRGEKPVYGNIISRVMNQGDENVFEVARIPRPATCPACGQTEKRFNNFGRTQFYHAANDEDTHENNVRTTQSGAKVKYVFLTIDEQNRRLAIDEKAFDKNIPLRKWNCKICKATFLDNE